MYLNDLITTIQPVLPGFLCCLFLFIFIFSNHTFQEKTVKKFYAAMVCELILLICSCMQSYYVTHTGNVYLKSIIYNGATIFKIGTVAYVVAISCRDKPIITKIIYGLLALNDFVIVLNIFTNIVFSFDSQHTFIRGPLFFIPYTIAAILTVIFFWNGIKMFHINPWESVLCVSIFTLCTISYCISLKPKFILLLPSSFVVSITVYFLYLNIQLYRRDTLTNLLNRRSFFTDAKKFYHSQITILSMDVNNLKAINEEFGHKKGDEALICIVKSMQNNFSKLGTIYRLGGDEFAALFINKKREDIERSLENFRKELKSTTYTVACGLSEYLPGNDFEQIFSASDENMYLNKLKQKEQKVNNLK